MKYKGKDITVTELTEESFKGVDIALFSAGGSISKQFGSIAVKSGAIVVDNSSAFLHGSDGSACDSRNQSGSGEAAQGNHRKSQLFDRSSPSPPYGRSTKRTASCVSSPRRIRQLPARALRRWKNYAKAPGPILRVVNTRTRCSPTRMRLTCSATTRKNLDPANGYNEEEMKMVRKETKKIFADEAIRISATCVRVPVLRAHSEALTVECENPITPDEVRAILAKAPGVKIVDDTEKNYMPMPKDASGQGDILCGRIRTDISDPSGKSFCMFVAGGSVVEGAALECRSNRGAAPEVTPYRIDTKPVATTAGFFIFGCQK